MFSQLVYWRFHSTLVRLVNLVRSILLLCSTIFSSRLGGLYIFRDFRKIWGWRKELNVDFEYFYIYSSGIEYSV